MTTDKIKDGGPAFPFNVPSYSPSSTAGYSPSHPTVAYQLQPGMSLRDWLAGQALASIPDFSEMSSYRIQPGNAEEIATTAYALADAMLKAREAQS